MASVRQDARRPDGAKFHPFAEQSYEIAYPNCVDHYESTIACDHYNGGWTGAIEFYRTDLQGNRMAVPETAGFACLLIGVAGCVAGRRFKAMRSNPPVSL